MSQSSNSRSPFEQAGDKDPSQRSLYEQLYEAIQEALRRGEDFECVGADQIALLRWRDARKAKRVYCSKEPYPYRRRGLTYTLSYTTYLRWEAFLEFCGIHGLDPRRESKKYGFGQPSEKGRDPRKTGALGASPASRPASPDASER